jgi:hypothetical protein
MMKDSFEAVRIVNAGHAKVEALSSWLTAHERAVERKERQSFA